MKPLAVLDLYLDDPGGAENLLRLLNGRPARAFRAVSEPLPESAADYGGLLMTGSAASILEDHPWIGPLERLIRDAARRQRPILGVCFGHQAIARALFGPDSVGRAPRTEFGTLPIEIVADDPLFDGVDRQFRTFVTHHDEVRSDAPGIEILARSADCAVQALRVPDRPIWGIQFHPEMLTPEIERLIEERMGEEPGLDLASMREERVDSEPLARQLMGNFLRTTERS